MKLYQNFTVFFFPLSIRVWLHTIHFPLLKKAAYLQKEVQCSNPNSKAFAVTLAATSFPAGRLWLETLLLKAVWNRILLVGEK